MFGDTGWLGQRYVAQHARLVAALKTSERPVVLEIGAGTHIPSVRYFTETVVGKSRGRLIRINPREFQVRRPADVGLSMGAFEAIALIDTLL